MKKEVNVKIYEFEKEMYFLKFIKFYIFLILDK